VIPKRLRWIKVAVVVLPLLALSALGCRVSSDEFQSRLFACDTGAKHPLCGTDGDGKDMTCFAARAVGGTFDFCTPACGDTPMSLPDEDAVCVQGGAKLKACDPNQDTENAPAPGPCGNTQLGCLRTNVIPGGAADEGVCVTGHPCLKDTDCGDFAKSTCAATFLQDLYGGTKDMPGKLHADHLYCLQKGCQAGTSNCSPGESCLPNYIPAAANPPDICVPNCDSHDRCPPNFFCYRKNSGPANPPICIPGLLGFVCGSDVDCMMGKCVSDQDPSPTQGLNLCTISCARDADCQIYDSQQGRFVCSKDGRCITPEAYRGASCNTTDDCSRDVGTVCVWAPPGPTKDPKNQGTCLRPCDATTFSCEARGGIGHTCLPFFSRDGETVPTCFPGYFPYPCFRHEDCAVPEMRCVGADQNAVIPQSGNCTIVCTGDEDCETNRWTGGQSFCASSFCVPLIADGDPCDVDKHCASGMCTNNMCAATGSVNP
jgi:hypothetical protein